MPKAIYVSNELGILERIILLCSFSFCGRNFVIFRYEGEDRVYAKRVSEESWNGTVMHGHRIDEAERRMAETLIDRSLSDSEKYPFNGEHYSIYEKETTEGKVTRVSRRGTLMHFRLSGRFFSVLLKMLFSFFAGLYITAIYCGFCKLYPLILFPELDFGGIARTVFALEAVGVILMFFLIRKRRSLLNLTIGILFPLGMLTLAAGVSAERWARIVVICVTGTAVVFTVLYDVITKPRRRTLTDWAYAVYTHLAVPLLCSALIIGGAGAMGAFKRQVQLEHLPSPEEVMSNYEQVLPRLEVTEWQGLTVDEKEEVLRRISEYECTYVLEIDPVTVEISVVEMEGLLGQYVENERKIKINLSFAETGLAGEVLETLLHETRHAWQYRIAEMYDDVKGSLDKEHKMLRLIRDAVAFEKNLNDPYIIDVTYSHYLSTAMEQDSRRWASAQINGIYLKYMYPDAITNG